MFAVQLAYILASFCYFWLFLFCSFQLLLFLHLVSFLKQANVLFGVQLAYILASLLLISFFSLAFSYCFATYNQHFATVFYFLLLAILLLSLISILPFYVSIYFSNFSSSFTLFTQPFETTSYCSVLFGVQLTCCFQLVFASFGFPFLKIQLLFCCLQLAIATSIFEFQIYFATFRVNLVFVLHFFCSFCYFQLLFCLNQLAF